MLHSDEHKIQKSGKSGKSGKVSGMRRIRVPENIPIRVIYISQCSDRQQSSYVLSQD